MLSCRVWPENQLRATSEFTLIYTVWWDDCDKNLHSVVYVWEVIGQMLMTESVEIKKDLLFSVLWKGWATFNMYFLSNLAKYTILSV